MGYASVREDNQRTLASVLSPVQTQIHTIACLLHQHTFVLCAEYSTLTIEIFMEGAISVCLC